MKKIIFCLFLCVASLSLAQTQQGYVKTRGRMVNGKHVPGVGLPGATVTIQGKGAVAVQKKDGAFSFLIPGETYMVESVQKKDYQLVDADAAPKHYRYSSNPLGLVMEKPEQQTADLLAKERFMRRELQKRVQQREEEIENLNVSLHEKNLLLQEIDQQREENEKIIKGLAEYYSTLDYDILDDFQQQVTYLLENCELERADSMLRSRGNMDDRIKEVQEEQTTEAEIEAQLERKKARTRKKLEDVAADCYSFYQRFLQSHQNDSAAHYLELRASLDTTNVDWQFSLYGFIKEYLSNTNGALEGYRKCLHRLENLTGENSDDIARCYNAIGVVYQQQRCDSLAFLYLKKALDIRLKLYGDGHEDVAESYSNIGSFYNLIGCYEEAQPFYLRSLSIRKAIYGKDTIQHSIATLYNNMGRMYRGQGKFHSALECYEIVLTIKKSLLKGKYHRSIAKCYNNIGILYMNANKFSLALDNLQEALEISDSVYGRNNVVTADILFSMGNSLVRLEHPLQAIEIFRQSHKALKNIYESYGRTWQIEKKLIECCLCIGVLYYRLGNMPMAYQNYNEALEYDSKAQYKDIIEKRIREVRRKLEKE